jgi:hypothetical protein
MMRKAVMAVTVAALAAVTLRCSDAPLITRQASRVVLSETFSTTE